MRRKLLLLAACCCVSVLSAWQEAAAGSYNEQGQFVGTVSSRISTLLAQYPMGGQALADEIARIVEADWTLADDAVYSLLTATPEQRRAIAEGLAIAVNYLTSVGNTRGARHVFQVIAYADPVTRAQFSLRLSPTFAGVRPTGIPSVSTSGVTVTNCVSQSSPSGC